jgi:hypothetical protein
MYMHLFWDERTILATFAMHVRQLPAVFASADPIL